MYDPMVAKLIVWDADREQATARMLRALGEYEIERPEDADPVPPALLATEQWARGETCRDLLEDRDWLKALAFRRRRPSRTTTDDEEAVEQTYTVEVVGPAIRRQGHRRRRRRRRAARATVRRPRPAKPGRASDARSARGALAATR